jgi:hypothetical protein
VVCLSAALLVCLPARAQDEDEPDYARTGLYTGISGSYAFPESLDHEQDELQRRFGVNPYLGFPGGIHLFKLDTKRSLGVQGKVGYRLHERIAVEGHAEWLVERSKFVTAAVNVKGFLTTGRAQPFILGGVGWYTANGTDYCLGDVYARAICKQTLRQGDGLAVRVGGGFDIYATEHLAITIDAVYVMPQGRLQNLDYVSAGWGLMYRF